MYRKLLIAGVNAMTIKEFLQEKRSSLTKGVPAGKALTPEELYYDCITVPYPSDPKDSNAAVITQAIKEWHDLLSWYAEQDGAVLLSRLYESEGTAGNWNNRRNALTTSGNYSYAFCSNHFARIIMTMALNGFVPDKQDFWDMLVTNREFYLSSLFGLTPVEKRLSAYNQKPYNAKFYTPGWYLAHIISVKDMPYKDSPAVDVKNIFKLGEESDWSFDAIAGCKIRKNKDQLSNGEKAVAVAHFLRCIDPINYFLVPNANNTVYKKIKPDDGSPLGENKFVVQYMLIKAYERFGATFEDFLNRSLADVDIIELCSKKALIAASPIHAEYAIGINSTGSSPKYTHDMELAVAAYYLRNNSGLVEIEDKVLRVSGKLGFDAKRILNEQGIDTSRKSPHKGILLRSNIDDEISRATGALKITLEEIKELGI